MFYETQEEAQGQGQYRDLGTTDGSITQSNEYTFGPGNYILDNSVIAQPQMQTAIPGIFSQPIAMTESETPTNIDTESGLIGLNNKITPNCERYSASEDLMKAKNMGSNELDQFYNSGVIEQDQILINTRMNAPVGSISEIDFNRFTHLHYDHQNVANIIVNEEHRGGSWSRNNFKDGYQCEVADNRGGNAF